MAARKRRSDSGWRAACLAKRGAFCRSCNDVRDVQADHIMPKSQGGLSVVENGLILCGPYSGMVRGGCHLAKTESRLQIRRSWPDQDQIVWLEEVGWVRWDPKTGVMSGRGFRHFAR